MSDQKDLFVLSVLFLGLFFVMGRSWKNVSLDPVRVTFDGVPEERALVRVCRCVAQLCVSLPLAGSQEVLLYLRFSDSHQCNPYQHHHRKLGGELLKECVTIQILFVLAGQ